MSVQNLAAIPNGILKGIPYSPRLQRFDLMHLCREEEAAQLGLRGAVDEGSSQPFSQITFVCWRGRSSISLLVDKASAALMAQKLEDAIQKFAQSHNPQKVE